MSVDYERGAQERTVVEAAMVLYREASRLSEHELVAPAEVVERYVAACRDLNVAMGNDDLDAKDEQ